MEVEAYRFGPFELRPCDYLLTRDGTPVHLNPKAFDALKLLIEHRGHVVDKGTLIASLWPDTIVEEANLSVQMAAVRKAMPSAGGSERYIETIPKRGYRFVADVTVVQSRTFENGRVVTPVAAEGGAIVVLPLKILRGDPRSSFLAFSLPDAVAASLADHLGIAVRSPLAAARYAGADADLATLASALRVSYALAGTLTDVGGRLAVRLQLLEVPSGTVLWSESRIASVDEMFELQDTVAARVALSLSARVGAARPSSRSEPGAPKNAGAYAFYLRANQLAYEASQWTQARALYRACLDLDPDYAPAWARLARCERLIGQFSSSAAEASISLARAEEIPPRARADPDLSIAQLAARIDLGRAGNAAPVLTVRRSGRPNRSLRRSVHAPALLRLATRRWLRTSEARQLDPTVGPASTIRGG